MSISMLRVNEVFAPTAQGEGPHLGHVCAFVRLMRCNLSCSWCDTPWTWQGTPEEQAKETRLWESDDLAAWVNMQAVERLVLTGGEPLVQQRFLPDFLSRVRVPTDVETNGTIAPTEEVADLVDLFVVSPKIQPSAAQDHELVGRSSSLLALAGTGKAVLKYVARDMDDLDAIHEHVTQLDLGLPVYVMPEGRSPEQITTATRTIADTVVEQGWRLTTRLHVLAWGDTRGH